MSSSALQTQARAQRNRAIKLVALPAEHGSWGFVLEPALLGLLLAPSVAGLWLAVAALAALLVRQPLKLALADRRGGKRYPRTVLAERFAAGYGIAALVALALAIPAVRGPFWIAIAAAAPLALLQAYYDMRRESRQLWAELAGAVAMGAVATAITLAAGWPLERALALWLVMSVRAVPSILYVRARLRLERGEQVDTTYAWVSQVVGLAAVAALSFAGLVPWLATAAVALLTARALWGMSSLRRPTRAQVIGVQEMVFGVLTVLAVFVGYRVHI